MSCLNCELQDCFEANHSPRAFKTWLQDVNQEVHLSQRWTAEELTGQWGSPLNVLSMPQVLNRVSFRNAWNSHTRCFVHVGTHGPDLHCGDFLFTVMSTDCHPRLSYSLTKWNFHFLVCKWVSPSAFVRYLFIQSMWQEQCTLINISAFTSL